MPLGDRDRSQLHLVRYVADRKNMRLTRRILHIDHHRAVTGQCHARTLKAEFLRVGRAAHREKYQVAVEIPAIGQMQTLASVR